ncbi:MAG TPA: hypothetical protein VFA75_10145 [Nevskia sp.]|nr:hypothetical protein [Nevskia sp.]
MLTSIRRSLSISALAATPFLLTACGGEDSNTKKVAVALVLAVCFTVSLAADLLKSSHPSGRAA